MSRSQTLFDRLKVDDSALVLYAFSHLKLKHRQVLRKAYGYHLLGNFDSSSLTEEEKKNGVFAAVRALKNILQNTEIVQVTIDPGKVREDSLYFYERFGEYDPRDVYAVFQGLDDSYQNVFQKVYGNYLLHPSEMESLTDIEKELFIEANYLLRHTLKSFSPVSLSHTITYPLGYLYTSKKRGTKPKNLFELNPQFTIQEVLEAVDQLTDEDKNYLQCAYGNHYCETAGYREMSIKEKNHLMWIIRGRLKHFLEHTNEVKEKKEIEEQLQSPYSLYFDYSYHEIKEAIHCLSLSDEKLIEKYFSDERLFISNKNISQDVFQHLKNIILNELLEKLSYVRNSEYLFQYFNNYSEEQILYGIYQLSYEGFEFIKELYGDDFHEVRKKSLSREEFQKFNHLLRIIENYIRNEEVYQMNMEEKKLSDREGRKKKSVVTNDFIHDRLSDLTYRKLSRQEEIDFIKKTRLSYYHVVDDETKKIYIEYYKEMFPSFRKSWEEAKDDDKKRERLLQRAIQNSLYYRNKFLENNFRLVFSVAKRYVGVDELENLYQEGVLGMMRALQKFDLTKGFRFSTYATLWIRQAITRYIADNSSTIRIPVHRRDQISRLERIEAQLKAQLGRKPSNEELCNALDIDADLLEEIKEYQTYLSLASLSTPIGEDEDTTLEDFVPNNEEDITIEVENDMMREAFRNYIENDAKLSDREKKVLFMRFGFYDGRVHTLDEIGQHFCVTRERIRQIEAKTLKILRFHLKQSQFNIDDYSLGNGSIGNNLPMNHLTIEREPIAKPKVVQTISRDSNGIIRTHKTLAFQMDTRETENIILEVLSRTNMRDFDQDTRDILNLRYGLSGVRASVEDTARILNLSEYDVSEKENIALKIIFARVSEDDLKVQQVKRMILKK